MARDVSLMISAKDNYSSAITKMLNVQTKFRKDVTALDRELKQLNANKATLKTDFTRAKKELAEAEKQFKAVGNEAAKMQLEAAQANYDNISRNFELVSKAAKQTQRDIANASGIMSKTQNQISGSGSKNQAGLLSSLAAAGMTAMLGNALGDTAGALINSAFGSDAGGVINSIFDSGSAGAALGLSVGAAPGAVIGAAVGALVGAIQGLTQVYEKQDDAYKTLVQDTYEEIRQNRSQSLESGTATAGQREIDMISFKTLLGGESAAEAFLKNVRETAKSTPFAYGDLTSMAKTLSTFGYTPEEMLNGAGGGLMMQIGDAGASLGMSSADMSMVATALGRMKSSGKTSLEYLNMLTERGIPAVEYLSQSMGKTKEQVYDMVSRGLIPGEQAAKVIADYMGNAFTGSMDEMALTYSGLTSTLEDLKDEMDNAMGEGFVQERKKGLDAQIAYFEGTSGDRLKEANRLIGAYEASLENEQERIYREKMDAALKRITDEGITNEAEAGKILAEAQSEAKMTYLTSDAYNQEIEVQKEIAEKIRGDAYITGAWQNAGYSMGQVFSEGMASAIRKNLPNSLAPGNYFYSSSADIGKTRLNSTMRGNAYGLQRVPYDNFPALLHEGEQVLTAGEARRSGNAPVINISGNSFSVREEADISKIAEHLAREVSSALMSYTG